MSYSKITEKVTKQLNSKRIHSLLPTPEEVKADKTLAYSDHLPILATLSFTDDIKLNIISLNILGAFPISGIHQRNSTESEQETFARNQRIMEGLKKCIENHDVDILALQETTPEAVPVLKGILGDNWKIIEDDFRIVTAYNSDKWNSSKTSSNNQARIRSMTLSNMEDDRIVIDFHNIWGNFDKFPVTLEGQCRDTLRLSENMAIIIGDTNSRLAPITDDDEDTDDTERNITTAAIPLMFNAENAAPPGVQVPDYPDGGFYKTLEGQIYQLRTDVLNLEDGSIYEDLNIKSEEEHWPEYRMIMCLDNYFVENPVINDQTLFSYESFLKREFKHDDIVVRLASDCSNHKAVGIGFHNDLDNKFSFIENCLKNEPGFQFKNIRATSSLTNTLQYYKSVFVIDKVHLLHQVISDFLFQEKHPILTGIKKFLTTSSWKRTAFFGACFGFIAFGSALTTLLILGGIKAIPAVILGPALAASLGLAATTVTLLGISLALILLFVVGALALSLLMDYIEDHGLIPDCLSPSNEQPESVSLFKPRTKFLPIDKGNDLVSDDEDNKQNDSIDELSGCCSMQ